MKKKFRDGKFFTTEKISPQKEKTPEGYLLCKEVPISRIGTFEYSGVEASLPNFSSVRLSRKEDELFNSKTVTSFEGKPVVISHARFADPDNWKDIAVGTVQNVRRGDGENSSFLLADLLLTDRNAIDAVESGQLKEVSCGYDADTEETDDGINQVGIVGNHVALVVNARCSGCRIGDGNMKQSIKNRLRKLFRDGDEDGFNEELDGMTLADSEGQSPQEPTPPAAPSLEERLTKLEAAVNALLEAKQAKTADAEETAVEADVTNSVDNEDEVVEDETAKQVLADAETLCPGMKKPVGDSKDGKFSRGMIERVMRTALKGSGCKQFGDSAELEGKALDIAFKAALELNKAGKNPKARSFGDSSETPEVNSIESIQKLFNDYWEKK